MATLLAAVEATLLGKDERLVAKCDVPGILAVFERWDIYDVATLSANLAYAFAELQRDLAPVAALSFLALLKATISGVPSAPPPDTPSSVPLTTPFTEAPPCFSPPIHPPMPATVPLVVTIKMNGKVLAERTTLPVPPAATWEAVAKTRLEAVLDAAEVQSLMSTPLAVSLFPTAAHSPSDRVSAAISDTVAGGFALGYPHVLLTLSPPVYGCARPAARGVDATARVMAAGERLSLPKPYTPKEGGKLGFELALFNALRDECEREGLGVPASDELACKNLLLAVRDFSRFRKDAWVCEEMLYWLS